MQRRLRCRAASLAAARATRSMTGSRNTSEGMAILAEASSYRPLPRRVRACACQTRAGRVTSMHGHGLPGIALAKPAAALAASAVLGFLVGYLQAHGTADAGAVAQLLLGPKACRRSGCDRLACSNRRMLTVLLFVSLGANLFLGGVLAGRSYGRGDTGLADPAQHPGDARATAGCQARAGTPGDQRRDAAGAPAVCLPCRRRAPHLPRNWLKPTLDTAAIERGFADVQTHTDRDQGRVATGHAARTASPHAGRAAHHGAGAGATTERRRTAVPLGTRAVLLVHRRVDFRSGSGFAGPPASNARQMNPRKLPLTPFLQPTNNV